MKQFEVLFKELDKNLAQLNIATYGLSDTTLEEIFLKVASNENDGAIVRGSKSLARSQSSKAPFHLPPLRVNQQIEDDSTDESGARKVYVKVEGGKVLTRSSNPGQKQPTVIKGKRLILKHVAALEIKRFHHSKRNKKGILCEIIMPAAFVCLAMCMTLIL